jgi:uronate dehydrogenase
MKILLTGGNGRIGRALRPVLRTLASALGGQTLRVSDREGSSTEHAPDEEILLGSITDTAFMDRLLDGVNVVVHMAATSNEQAFPLVLDNNHKGLYELYEGARRHGLRRILYASSNHAFGLHPVGQKLKLDAPFAADCFYGLSKVWGEALARMYWEKHGIETVALRIGTFMGVPPRNERELATWMGQEDLESMVRCAIEAQDVGFAPVWGISDNRRAYYDVHEPNKIGFVPKQDAEVFAAETLAAAAGVAVDPVATRYQGGKFVTQSYTPEGERPKPLAP